MYLVRKPCLLIIFVLYHHSIEVLSDQNSNHNIYNNTINTLLVIQRENRHHYFCLHHEQHRYDFLSHKGSYHCKVLIS